jgi:hypothetical protein
MALAEIKKQVNAKHLEQLNYSECISLGYTFIFHVVKTKNKKKTTGNYATTNSAKNKTGYS